MKNFITPIIAVFLILFVSGLAHADYKDLKGQSGTEVDFWVGGEFTDLDTSKNDGKAEEESLPEAATRVGTNRAAEWEALDNSPSGGFLIIGTPQPQRYHLEFDYLSENDWFGDLRHSYLDYFQIRLLSRRFYHNLDNLTLFDYNPSLFNAPETPPNTGSGGEDNGNDVEINDAGIDDYGVRIDIDQLYLRLKAPNFPLHFYTQEEIVRKKGVKQSRFLGGQGYLSGNDGRIRVSESVEVDQEKKEFTIGSNAHLRWVSIDYSFHNRKFDSDSPIRSYDYTFLSGVAGAPATTIHAVVPSLEANTNTFKIHSTHSGRISGSATFSKIDKKNNTSGAEAENTLSYAEMYWRPMIYFSLSTKYRHLSKDASAPATIEEYGQKVPHSSTAFGSYVYDVLPGVKSDTDTAILAMKYSQIPSTNLNFQYTNRIKEVDDQSAIDWSKPYKTTKNIYQVVLTNWAIPKVRTSIKYVRTDTDNDFFIDLTSANSSSVNNDPAHVDRGVLGLTWLISPKIAVFFNADVTMEETGDNRQVGIDEDYLEAEALNQVYLTSLNFIISDKLSITPTYTYFSYKQDRDLIWEDFTGAHTIDSDYSNIQRANSFALSVMLVPTKEITINGTIDYTKTDGSYDPTSPFDIATAGSINTADIAQFSETSTQEINLNLDTEYELGHGWGLGLDLRYTDWQDDSFDNPADGTFIGGLFKITKKMSIR